MDVNEVHPNSCVVYAGIKGNTNFVLGQEVNIESAWEVTREYQSGNIEKIDIVITKIV